MTNTKKIRRAVFSVAGFGTHFRPMTKAMPKESLPIVHKPLSQCAAQEAITIHALQGHVETVQLNRRRFQCGSVDGFIKVVLYDYQKRLQN